MAIKVIGKVSIVPQGEYQADTTYPRLSLVYYQGGSYIAVVESTNIVPTDTSSWQQVAAPGNGISSIEKISTVGLVDTYRITYTNGDHFDFTINNGATKTSELTNDSGFIDKDVDNLTNYLLKTSTGATIEITYDSSAYTVTANLKNSSNTIISTSTIQLPSGASIVNASYNEETYIITLAQRNGTNITLDLSNSFNAKEDIVNKTDELNGNSTEDEYPNAQITYEKIHELQEQGISQEAQGQEIFLYDATNLPPKEITLSGNATQDTNILTYKCDGTETGDYYFVYDSTNYQFTMPTITANELLTFNTTTLKLYQGTTQITTTTASTGTLITLSGTPNPDYPQDIHVVTGNNTVKVSGKNLLNIPNNTRTSGGLTCTVANGVATVSGTTTQNAFFPLLSGINLQAGTYTLSANNNLSLGTGDMLRFVTSGGADTTPNIRVILDGINNSKTFTITEPLNNVTLQIRIAHPRTISTSTPLIIKSQLEVGSTATTYEPYIASSTQLLSLGSIELAKIGDYTDKLFHAVAGNTIYENLDSTTKASLTSGKWYKQENIGKYTFTGNESGNLQTNNETTYLYNISGKTFNVPNNTTNYINNYSLPNSTSSSPSNTNLGSYIYNSTFRLRVPSSIATTYEQFQTWLSSANCIIYFALSTPTYIEITDTTLISQLNKLEAISLLRGYTYIYTEIASSNVNPYIKLVYIKDLNVVVDELQSFNELLLDQVPIQQVSGILINVQDSSNLPTKEKDLLGEATQKTNVLTYTCNGEESGDYYFVYNSTNYQFTMPEVVSGDVLAFNIDTLKLYKGTTEIATTTAGTGTLITMSATPNPDYPQDIHVVTGDVTYKQCGKNLLPTYQSNTSAGVTFTANNTNVVINGTNTGQVDAFSKRVFLKAGTYTFCVKYKSGTASTSVTTLLQFLGKKVGGSGPDIFSVPINVSDYTTNKSRTFTIAEDLNIRIYIYIGSSQKTFNNLSLDFQLVNGDTPDYDMETYHEETITLPLGNIELAKIGDYQDILFKAITGDPTYDSLDSTTKSTLTSGKWYKQGNVGKVVFNGSEGNWGESGNRFIYSGLSSTIKPSSSNSEIAKILSDKFVGITINNTTQTIPLDGIAVSTSGNIVVYYETLKNNTYQEFETWLSSNNVILYYVLATPTYTQITDETLISRLNEWEAKATYRNITNMWLEPSGTNAQGGLDIVYRQDLQTLTDKIEALEARVALLE